jgi:RNA recognition motif-containing protein
MNIFVGNLHVNTEERALNAVFQEFGLIKSLDFQRDLRTGRFRGFAFVEMFSDAEALTAISILNNKAFLGKRMVVNVREN